MATDDRRMHEGDKPGLAGKRGPNHREDSAAAGDAIGTDAAPPREGDQRDADAASSTTDREQDSALGGHVGTRSVGP